MGENKIDQSSREGQNFPVHPTIRVLAGTTIYKTPMWWSAITLQINRGRLEVCQYLWNNRKDKETKQPRWNRKQKAVFRDPAQWEKARKAIDDYLGGIADGKYSDKLEQWKVDNPKEEKKEEDDE